MIDTMAETVDAWYARLNGALSVSVFIESAPDSHTGDYVLLRAESESNNSTKAYYGRNTIVITDIVTFHQNMINTRKVDEINGEIVSLILPSPGGHELSVSGFQISNIQVENSAYLQEDNGQSKIFRKSVRYNHLINE
jgi:hypothetical protein